MSRRLLAVLAVSSLLLATGCNALSTRIHMSKGNKAYKAAKYDDAIKEYKQILAINPNNFSANYLVAMSNLAMYHPGSTHPKDISSSKESITYFEKLLTLDPPGTPDEKKAMHAKLQKYYLSLLTAAGQEDKAIAYLEAQRAKNPNDIAVLQQLAGAYAKKDFNKAMEAFEKLAQLEPKNKERWYTIGEVCWEKSYKGGMAVSDQERTALVNKGLDALQKAVTIDPDYAESWAFINLLHREMAKVYTNQNDRAGWDKEMAGAKFATDKAIEINNKRKAKAPQASTPAATQAK